MEKKYLAKIDYRSSEASKIKNIFQEFLYKFSKIFKYIKSRSQVTELVENPYERFVRDEIRDCYDYFKKYFYNTIFFNEALLTLVELTNSVCRISIEVLLEGLGHQAPSGLDGCPRKVQGCFGLLKNKFVHKTS